MKNIFDYTFYRVTKLDSKKDYENRGTLTGRLMISFVVFLYLLTINYLIIKLLKLYYIDITHKLSGLEKILALGIMVLIDIIVKKRYKGKYQLFDEKWKNETNKEKLIGGILCVIFIFSPLILSGLMNIAFGLITPPY